MKNRFLLPILVVLMSLSACLNNHSVKEKPMIYFDLNGFLQKQIADLEKQKPLVKKKVSSETKVESKTLQIVSWQKELKMFQEADINKTIYKDLYEVKEENLANGHFRTTYIAKREDLKTRFLSVEQSADKQTVLKINAKYLDYNFLYKSERELNLEHSNNQKTISHYSVQGVHNNLFGSRLRYQVETEILKQQVFN